MWYSNKEVNDVGVTDCCSIFTFVYLTGVNLLIGTENGLMLLDRSGQNKGKSFLSDIHGGLYDLKDSQLY